MHFPKIIRLFSLLAILCSLPFGKARAQTVERPPNDDFAHAEPIVGTNGVFTASGSTLGATREPNEPLNTNGVASAWFKWLPEKSGSVRLNVEENRAEAWLFYAHGDGFPGLLKTAITNQLTEVLAGSVYYVAVYSPPDAGVEFRVAIHQISPPPANDNFANALQISLTNDLCVVEGSTVGATLEDEETGVGTASVWYRLLSPADGKLRLTLDAGTASLVIFEGAAIGELIETTSRNVIENHSYYFRVSATNEDDGAFRFSLVHEEPEPPANDLFKNATILEGASNFLTGDFERATAEEGEIGLNGGVSFPERTLWWKYEVQETGNLLMFSIPPRIFAEYAVFRGDSLNSLEPLYGGRLGDGRFIPVNAGDTIHVQVQKSERTPELEGVWMQCGVRPVNDDFANAMDVGSATEFVGQNFGATTEPTEPNSTDGNGRTVWFKWTAPFEGRAIFNCGQNTTIRLYRGNELANLVPLPNPGGGIVFSSGYHSFNEGDVLYLQIGSVIPEGKMFTVRIFAEDARPVNDAFADAIIWTDSSEMRGVCPLKYLTREPGEPVHASYSHKSVWWRWKAEQSGEAAFEGRFGTNQAGVALYVGDAVDRLELVAKSDGAIVARVEKGKTYHIAYSVPLETEDTMHVFSAFWPRIVTGEEPGNLILNGSFESTTDPWLTNGVVAWETYGASPPNGLNFALMNGPAASLDQAIITEPEELYDLVFSASAIWPATTGEVRVVWGEQPIGEFGVERQWRSWSLTVVGTGTNLLRLEWVSGTVAIDAVSVRRSETHAPSIVQQPRTQRVLEDGNIDLRVQANGTHPLFFEWYRNGARLTNQRDAAVVITNATIQDAGSYHVVISNAAGSIQSTNARVEVAVVTNTTILVQPISQTIFAGEYHALAVFASGPKPLSYQWHKNDEAIDGATANELIFTNATAMDAGNYQVVVSGPGGIIASDVVQVEVVPAVVQSDGGLLIDYTYFSKVYGIGGSAALSGNTFCSQFFFGTSVDNLRPFEQPLEFANEVFAGIPVNSKSPANWSFPHIPKLAQVYFQMRVWERSYGPTYEHAKAAGAPVGQSPVLAVQRVIWGTDRWTIIEVPSFEVLPGFGTFVVPGGERMAQEIDFPELQAQEYIGNPIQLEARTSSGLPVRFAVMFGPAVITNSSLFPYAAGRIGVTASQPGNANFFPATEVQREFELRKGQQTIIFERINTNAPIQLQAESSIGLPVSFEVVQGFGSIHENILTEVGDGPITIRASQSGNALVGPAIPVDQTFVIRPLDQSIVFLKIPDVVIGTNLAGELRPKLSAQSAGSTTNSIQLRAFASSGLPVSYTLLSGAAVLTGDVVRPAGLGQVRIRAVQQGDEFFKPAPTVEQSFYVLEVPRAKQTITFDLMPSSTLIGTPIKLFASASSGLHVSYAVVEGSANLTSDVLVAEAAGVVIVEARQDGNDAYAPTSLRRSITFFAAPEISIHLDATSLTLSWILREGTHLEKSDSPSGPWEKVADVEPGRFSIPRGAGAESKFYRLILIPE